MFSFVNIGICNAYLNIRHAVGMFFDWPDIFLFGRARSLSERVGKTRYEISYASSEGSGYASTQVSLSLCCLDIWNKHTQDKSA